MKDGLEEKAGQDKLEALYPKTHQESQLMIVLGVILQYGMNEVDSVERFTGGDIENTYRTHFNMPDGREWEITIKRRKP